MRVIEKKIKREGITRPVRILHITDTHFVLWDERDDQKTLDWNDFKGSVSEWAEKKYGCYKCGRLYSYERLERLCRQIRKNADRFDAVVFSGDILDFYTDRALEFMEGLLSDFPIPYMFVLGNHDLISSPSREDSERAKFNALCKGDTFFQRISLGEVTLIGIDNSSRKYQEASLDKLEAALREERNVIIVEHLPISERNMREGYALSEYKGDDNGRKRFLELITESDSPVFALLGGDDHVDQEINLKAGLVQYVGPLTLRFPPVLFTIEGEKNGRA